jgi:hypothetical protein
LAAEVWAEDPEGAFTSALPSAAVLKPPEGEDWLETGRAAVAAEQVPPGRAATSLAPEKGAEETPDWRWGEDADDGGVQAGLESVSATTLDWPAMWRMVGENSAINDKCRCCRLDQGSERRLRAPTSGLWSVKTVKERPSSIKRKCLMAATTAESSLSNAL